MNSTIKGKVSQGPELKVTTNGKPYTMFKLNVDSVNVKLGVPEVLTVNVKTWNEVAENVDRHVYAGNEVECTGRWDSRNYQGKDGQMREWTEFIAFEVSANGAKLGNNGFVRADNSFIPDPNADLSLPGEVPGA